ncbi:MAG: ATP-binding protein [Butyrivibrio sp.]
MTKRIFRSICAVALSVFVVALFLIMGVLYNYFSKITHNQLKSQTAMAARAVEYGGLEYLETLEAGDCRITWIDAEGKVLYDSVREEEGMENHISREEVTEALEKGYGESTRFSSTLSERTLYSALKLSDGTILRLSVSQNSVGTMFLGMTVPILIIAALVVLVSSLLASKLSRKIVEPLNEINLDEPLSNKEYDEIAPLLTRIESQQRALKNQKQELKQKQDEFNTVTSNMNEGLILLNEKWNVLSINTAAIKFFGSDEDCIGRNILEINRSLELQRLLSRAEKGQKAEKVISLPMGEFQLDVTPVFSGDKVSGGVVLIFDVTERENSEQMRREFTANVSHELKTPLHSISGYAELLQNGMVQSEDISGFAGKIYIEAQRMIHLVEDIIRLSRLDEGGDNMAFESVDLYSASKEVIHSLSKEADSMGVQIVLWGDKAVISGIPQLVKGIIFNLCDNAIKYNVKGGKVDVEIREEPDGVRLSVSDTGIGIPPEHLSRVFERFYRVDKSHSKEVGGTGLGLSIVKHSAKIQNAKVDIKSTPGEGTTITVKFMK